MTTQSPLSPAAAPLASLCKAAGDALRLDILRALARDSYGVLELAQAFGVKQSLLSHHLKTLTQAGLLHSRREGNTIFYRRPPLNLQDPWAEFKQTLFASLDKTPLAPPYNTNCWPYKTNAPPPRKPSSKTTPPNSTTNKPLSPASTTTAAAFYNC